MRANGYIAMITEGVSGLGESGVWNLANEGA